MILSDVRDYIRRRGQVSLQDLALHFDVEPDALRGMLERWIEKGKVERRSANPACGSSCSQCQPDTVELYAWVEATMPLMRDLGCPSGLTPADASKSEKK